MTYAEAKDQVALTWILKNMGYTYTGERPWERIVMKYYDGDVPPQFYDEAASLAIASSNDDGYRAGYTDAYEGRPHKFAVQKDWDDELPY